MSPERLATLPALLEARAAQSPDLPAQLTREAPGRWSALTWAQLRDRARRIALALEAAGLERGDRLAIVAAGSPLWDQVQFGVLYAGGTVVGLDGHEREDNLAIAVGHAQPVVLVLQEASLLAKFPTPALASVRLLVVLEGEPPTSPGPWRALALERLLGEDHAGRGEPRGASPEDIAALVFTSGTTGAPKGIAYTHRQICLAVDALLEAFEDIGQDARLASWLPLSNLFQRMLNFCAIGRGARLYYVPDPRRIMECVGEIEPHLLIGVPRFYEKLHEGIGQRLRSRPAPVRALARWALAVGMTRAAVLRAGGRPGPGLRLAHALADRLVLGRVRRVLGGNLRYLLSGSAPMPKWLLEAFDGLGLLVLEAYGMSESVLPVTTNRPGRYRFGTVGLPLRGNELRTAEDGELLLRGPGVFRHYLGERADAPAWTAEGFLPTGDYAEIAPDGFVTLKGRKSEVFKTSTGRRIAPVAIETCLKQVPGVEHAVVFGEGRKCLAALLVLSETGAPEALQGLREAVRRAVATLPEFQRPAGLVLTRQPLAVASGELTANLKLRRQVIAARYAAALEALHAALEREPGPFARDLQPAGCVLVGL